MGGCSRVLFGSWFFLGLASVAGCGPKLAEFAEPRAEKPSSLGAPRLAAEPAPASWLDWRDDPEIVGVMRDSSYEDGREPGRPSSFAEQRLVDREQLEVLVIHASWVDGRQPWETRVDRLYLLLRTAQATHVVPLVRQYRENLDDNERRSPRPQVRDVEWRGDAVVGPELVLSVDQHSVWGTQCDEGYDVRSDVVICELDQGAVACARVPVDLRYYDGCGGRESYDVVDGPFYEEPECSRVSFSSSWMMDAKGLTVTPESTRELHCLALGSSRGIGEPWPPPNGSIPYRALFEGPYRIEVFAVAAASAGS